MNAALGVYRLEGVDVLQMRSSSRMLEVQTVYSRLVKLKCGSKCISALPVRRAEHVKGSK